MALVDVEGCRIYAEVEGREKLPWLVLSNCLAADHTMWDGDMEWLLPHFRVLRYDTRGHGRSDPPASAASLPQLVADAVAAMDYFRVERAVFLGLSIGAMTGMGLALQFPSRISRLVCVAGRSDAPGPFVQAWSDRIARIGSGGMAAIHEETIERWLSDSTRQDQPGEVERASEMLRRTTAAGYVACARALQRLAYRKDLPRIAAPALFVAGGDDAAAPAVVMSEMAAAVPGARFIAIPGARHLVNVDRPAGFRRALEPFLLGQAS